LKWTIFRRRPVTADVPPESSVIESETVHSNPYATPSDCEPVPHAKALTPAAFFAASLFIALAAWAATFTPRPSVVSPFPLPTLLANRWFGIPNFAFPLLAGGAFAILHIRGISGRISQSVGFGRLAALCGFTLFTALYFVADFQLGLVEHGLTHTLIVLTYNLLLTTACWGLWFRSRRNRPSHDKVIFDSMMFTWGFWCFLPYLGEI
jgi:hypothetical protein